MEVRCGPECVNACKATWPVISCGFSFHLINLVFAQLVKQWSHIPLITRFPLKGAPKVKEVLAKNVPYAREAPKINFDRVFHTKAKTRSKLILEASRPGPLSP